MPACSDLVRVSGHEDWSQSQIDDAMEWLSDGIHLEGERLRPAQVVWQNKEQLRVTLLEGRHRQIRRMCQVVGMRVDALKRTRIGTVQLRDIKAGCWVALPDSAASELEGKRGAKYD